MQVVGVRFQRSGEIVYCDPGEQVLHLHQFVLVAMERGPSYGEIVEGPRAYPRDQLPEHVPPVIRPATPQDVRTQRENEAKAYHALEICAERIAAHQLPMQLVAAEYTFDRGHLTFYFTAEGRVDFRALVRDLAAIFHVRIELHQLGARDQAKRVGGIGRCGRELCCSSFLTHFSPVTIKTAREQASSVNPSKISGMCGRLLCCLRYEVFGEDLPAVGARVETMLGSGVVRAVDAGTKRLSVELDETHECADLPANECIAAERAIPGGVNRDAIAGLSPCGSCSVETARRSTL